MRNCRDLFDLKTLKLIYHALVYPNLIYCVTAWGCATQTALKPLVTVHKRIIRSLYGVPSRTHTYDLMRAAGFLNISQIHNYVSNIFILSL